MASLIRFAHNPEVRRMQREFDRLFDNFFPTRPEHSEDMETAVWTPRVDLSENDEAYFVHLDVPGMTKDDFKINFHEGVLSVSGERKEEKTDENRSFVRIERNFGCFYRSFNLPKLVKIDKVSASYDNGVLNISVPKAEESKPRRIEIK